ncbi:Probable RNA-directed DNA polymerase from transposon BS [Eumeta japonica]|uniref:Probable RNA-directed DNA polymerase from transposon BS n=1 Tax=Eumeta variegata TaxID=151549 RepID=A0A4C1TVQ0_EUMVA|nr:Probable RNA-directed DNA polymerase from transposon BS [Eumeta japonica]
MLSRFPRHRSYQSHRGRGSPKTSLEPKDDLAPVSLSEVQTLVKSIPERHRPRCHSCPQQVLRLVEYVSEGFETEHSTVAVFFDVAKAFDRVWHAANRHFTFRHERTHSTRRLIRAGVPQGSTLSPVLPRTQTMYRDRRRLASNSRAIDELGQWFRKWRIEVNPDKSAAIQFKYGKIRSRLIVDKNTPNLKMLDAIIPWQRNYKYLGVTLDKNLHFRDHIERVRNTALFYKARLGAVLGRKSKLSRRNKRTIYKMCIRTVMTYASPVFAHAAPKALHRLQGLRTPHYFQIYEGRIEAILRHRGITSQCALRAAVDYQPPHPTHLSSGHRPKLPYSTRPPLTASGRREGTDPDGFLQHSMPRRLPGVVHSACHAPSALACAVRPHSVKLSKSSDLSSDSSRPTK